ncbi:hypothetical protein GQ53DRAFT_744809 [Thozetella sp. PMI_491]|nr:hypothetical protein GQ53DRAFT_744809 [Thozetella sp. PMI_491]
MGGAQQPFLYEAEKLGDDDRFPATTFDPKAVTRASYEAKPKKKKKKNGPLISVNRHPDMFEVPRPRSQFRPMSRTTKGWIQGIRVVQLVLRVLEVIAAVGLLTVMILLSNIEELAGWILRITFGVNILHCSYAIYHLCRAAGARTPGSSAAYHTFAGISDLAVLPLYAYGVLSIRNDGSSWDTLLANKKVLDYFVPGVYYTLVGAGGLHVVSLAISLWLGIMFRRISMMPPDMNPLEDHLTARAHKRNKSSVTTASYAESEKRLSTPLENRRRSGVPYEDVSRPPSVPFMHTRHRSEVSLAESNRDSRINLPSRRYQIEPGNSPRNSVASADLKRMSCPPVPPAHGRGSYTEIPLAETGSYSRPQSSYSSRPSSGTVPSYKATTVTPTDSPQPRAAKFTEAWYASESLINRTQQRNRAINQMVMNATGKRSAYEAVNQRTGELPDSDEENDDESKYENSYAGIRVDEVDFRKNNGRSLASPTKMGNDENEDETDLGVPHPNPLRSHPTPPPKSKKERRPHTPFNHAVALSEVSLNDRRVSGSTVGQDIAELKHLSTSTWEPRNRDSSIQPEAAFYSKPYGELKAATPPVMQTVGIGRQVSSGNDYDMGMGGGFRRAVSGKVAEEGRAGANRFSRYGGAE